MQSKQADLTGIRARIKRLPSNLCIHVCAKALYEHVNMTVKTNHKRNKTTSNNVMQIIDAGVKAKANCVHV